MNAYLEQEEIELLELAATNIRDRLLIRTLWHLGCRVSEAIALEVGNINLEKGTVTIQHLKSSIKLNCPHCNTRLGKSHCFCPKCGIEVKESVAKEQQYRRVRTIPLDKETLETVKQFIEGGGPIKRDGKQRIFGINRHRAWQIIRACADKANLSQLVNPETGRIHGVSPHRLRDAFAVHAMKIDDTGDGLRLLQEQLGHASFNTTAKYRKVAGEELKDWYEKIWKQKPSTCPNE